MPSPESTPHETPERSPVEAELDERRRHLGEALTTAVDEYQKIHASLAKFLEQHANEVDAVFSDLEDTVNLSEPNDVIHLPKGEETQILLKFIALKSLEKDQRTFMRNLQQRLKQIEKELLSLRIPKQN